MAEVLTEPTVVAPGRPADAARFSGHMPGLDGLRGVAISLVMAVHFVGNAPHEGAFERVLARLAGYGTYGVDLFFVLSGFLITGILFDSKGSAAYYKNFYARRTLRIFPLYYAVLFACLVLGPLVFGASYPDGLRKAAGVQLWLWTYATNFYLAPHHEWGALPYVGHFWSLAVEEHFYLFWPFVIRRLSPEAAVRVCTSLIVGSLLLRVGLQVGGVTSLATYVLTPCRLDHLCTGSLLALLVRDDAARGRLVRMARAPWLLPVGAVALVPVTRLFSGTSEMLLRECRSTVLAGYFGFVVLRAVVAAPELPSARFFRSRPLRFLGKYSYGLYVYHGIVAAYVFDEGWFDWLLRAVGNHHLALGLEVLVGVGASLAIAMASFEWFESRLLRLKARFSY